MKLKGFPGHRSRLPPRAPLFGLQRAELAVQLRPGPGGAVDVHVTVDRSQAAVWRLRADVPRGTDLALLVPTRDDFGNREGVRIHGAWWGKLPPLPTHKPFRGY